MQVDAGEFIGKLRDRLAVKLDEEPPSVAGAVMAAFDRSCVEALVEEHDGQKHGLSPQQRAAITRAKNKAARQAALRPNGAAQPGEASHGDSAN